MAERDPKQLIRRFLKSAEAFEYQLIIPRQASSLPPQTLIRMAKKAARRGHVRWFVRLLNRIERQWIDAATNVQGVDDLETFLAEHLDSTIGHNSDGRLVYPLRNVVVVCFQDKSDARSFCRELYRFNDAMHHTYLEAQRPVLEAAKKKALTRLRLEVQSLNERIEKSLSKSG
ncbi:MULTISPECIES: hypothetical protein [unclassified Sphingobium]|uniref:hypothetical protein n=1 Tax=unclassified Sphingobium TaxID=2611147 RepID=UPI002224FE6B|nr:MULTISPECIES: hypothetical protein [unclassified Sphingobium]MCW2412949.1 hypothetical protein [Sphingobium sp. B8D3D]MCW2414753.1 hypothetical protein [Sphingobium sp. B8D3A]